MLRVRAVAAALYGQAGGGVPGVELGVEPLVELPGVEKGLLYKVLSFFRCTLGNEKKAHYFAISMCFTVAEK